MRIGIVGYGIVGKATELRLAGNEFYILDPPLNLYEDISNCEIVFVCVNDTDPKMPLINKIVKDIDDLDTDCAIVIRTSITPGTTDKLIDRYNREIAYVPEFLREWNWKHDALNPDKTIIGTENDELYRTLKSLFKDRNALQIKPIEAEISKLALNSLGLIKVVFAEELHDFTLKHDADYENIYKVFMLDQNINIRHLYPNHCGYRGAGGKCLPKDSEFLSESSQVLRKAIEVNNKLRGK